MIRLDFPAKRWQDRPWGFHGWVPEDFAAQGHPRVFLMATVSLQMSPPADLPPRPAQHGRAFWLIWLGSWILRALVLTLRVRVHQPEMLRAHLTAHPIIFVFWHNQLLLVPIVWQRFLNPGTRPHSMALTSMSKDGEWVAQFLSRFGIGAVRGSERRGGAASLRALAGWLKRGHDVGITPDGSRGPIYEIKPGLVLLAQLTGCAVVPLSFKFSGAWRLKSWDRFFIPKPFSRVTFCVGTPHKVERTTTPAAFEVERLRCEQHMQAQIDER